MTFQLVNPDNKLVPTRVHFVLKRVTCAQGHRLISTYLHDFLRGRCRGHGSRCLILYPGGWTCSTPPTVQIRNGITNSCFQGTGASRSVGITLVSRSIDNFRSPDGKVWCEVFPQHVHTYVVCATSSSTFPQRSALLDKSGKVNLCFIAEKTYPPGSSVPDTCAVQFDATAPILRTGQRTSVGEFECRSGRDGITCTLVSGTHKGKGFRISVGEAVKVG